MSISSLELELQTAVCCSTGSGIKPRSSRRVPVPSTAEPRLLLQPLGFHIMWPDNLPSLSLSVMLTLPCLYNGGSISTPHKSKQDTPFHLLIVLLWFHFSRTGTMPGRTQAFLEPEIMSRELCYRLHLGAHLCPFHNKVPSHL